MKKFFAVLGIVFLIIIVLGAVGIGFIAVRGNALDKESRAYANAAIPAIVSGWNEKELVDRASPEFKKAVTQQQLDQMFHWFTSLGRLQKCEPAQGQAGISVTPQTGKVISGQYAAKAKFEKGDATIKLALIKHENQWQVLSLYVDSPALVPH
ncbi:MAG TPA: hypothetical protein VEQ38_06740 [Verrucomicrobiae bacterium]|nr:hypothetical protein [Verrucomicrobiae bacterium]